MKTSTTYLRRNDLDKYPSGTTSKLIRLPLKIVQIIGKRSTILEIISASLIVIFLYAAVTKLLDYETFKVQLSKSPFITLFSAIIAWVLPVVEIATSMALLIKPARLYGMYASLFLMTLFTAYIFSMLQFSYYLPCSCGGLLSKMDWNTHLWFNLLFTVLSCVGIILLTSKQTQSNK